MKGLLAAIAKGGVTLVLILIIVLLLIWFGGEQLGFSRQVRGLVAGGVLVLAILIVVVQKAMAVRSAMLIEKKLRAQAQEQVESARPDQRADVQAVQSQLDEAIQALKTSRLGKGALYKLPWYMIIGPPGSGKSTALQESGLNFPYVSQGKKGIRGVGGTRNCDWWFTDEGILLDTAGRYTTELDDREEWLGFLDLLKNARKGKPINGAIVAVAVSDLLGATDEEIENHAKTIRNRIDELTTQLEIVFPVYLLFTKCDLLQGFVEFFEDFTKQDRAQVWGCSMPYSSSVGKQYREIFEEETQRLFRSLANQRLASLVAEKPSAKKQNMYLFPMQFSAATKKLSDFVGALFRPNPFQESSVFRGFYFTSGTQEGTPIDQVIRSMSAAFGLKDEGPATAPQPADKKSYFLNHLFTKIVFPDQNLARTSARVQRRQKLVHFATLGISAVGTLFLIIALVVSFFGNRSLLKDAEAAAVKVREAQRSAPAAELEALDVLRGEAEQLDQYDREGAPLGKRWGLYRGNTVNSAIRHVYFESLRRHYLGPCAERLRRDLDEFSRREGLKAEDYSRLDELHQVYQMLGGELDPHLSRDLVQRTLSQENRWFAGTGGQPTPAGERQLKFFITQLDRPKEWKVSVDTISIERVNGLLAQGLWVLESYRKIIAQGQGSFGKVTGETFVRGRGRELLKFNKEFSQLFTQAGWNDYVRSAIRTTSETLAERFARLKIKKTAAQVESELKEKHVERYAREWDEFLQGVQVLPFQNLEDAAGKMKVLAGDQSPFNDLFKGVWEMQRLKVNETDLPPGAVELKPYVDSRNPIYEFQQTIEEFVASTQGGNRVTGSIKEGKIQPLLDSFKKAVRGLDAGVRTAPPALQERLRGVLYQLIDNTRQALAVEAQNEGDALWARTVHRLYKEQIQGKYPFEETGPTAATVAAVTQLFNPQTGLFWTVYNDLKSLNGINLEGKPLVAFSREYSSAVRKAETFRQALFRGGGEKLNVPFKVTLKQREGVTHLKIEVGKKEFNHNDRPDNRGDLTWADGDAGAKLSIRVVQVQRWFEKEFKDDWGILRLIASGNPQPQGDKNLACSYEFQITQSGVEKIFLGELLLENDDRVNPFSKEFFGKFVVPEKVGP